MDVLLCDDHPLSREGIESILRKTSGLRELSPQFRVAGSGTHLIHEIEKSLPDFAVVDLGLPDISGLDLIRHLVDRWPTLRILVLTASQNSVLLEQVRQLPICGLLSKSNSFEELDNAFIKVLHGEERPYLDSRIRSILKYGLGQPLSKQEYSVLALLAQGKDRQEIAQLLNCHKSTVRSYIDRISSKTGAQNTAEMIALYIQGNIQKDAGASSHL